MVGIYIDDQDLSQVVYNGTWVKGGTAREYAGTVASSTNVGDSFTVSFKGTVITVYGTFDATSQGVVTTYSVDGAPPAQVTAQAGTGDTTHQQFWKSNQLALTQHKLVVTMAKVNHDDPTPGEGTVWFDYFIATDPTITSSAVPSPSSTLPLITNARTTPPVGAIVGGVIGGLFFILGAASFLLFFCRRRKRAPSDEYLSKQNDDLSTPRQGTIQPFLLDAPSVNSSLTKDGEFDPRLLIPSSPLPTRKLTAAVRRPMAPTLLPPGLSTDALESPSASPDMELSVDHSVDRSITTVQQQPHMNTKTITQLQLPKDGYHTRRHIDSGIRATNFQPLTLAELPPVYSPV